MLGDDSVEWRQHLRVAEIDLRDGDVGLLVFDIGLVRIPLGLGLVPRTGRRNVLLEQRVLPGEFGLSLHELCFGRIELCLGSLKLRLVGRRIDQEKQIAFFD